MQSKLGMLRDTNEGNAVIRFLSGAGAIPTGGLSLVGLGAREAGGMMTRKTQEELGRLLLDPSALNTLLSTPAKALTPAQQQLRKLAEAALRSAPAATATEGQ